MTPIHSSCSHSRYRLTCTQYEDLRAQAHLRCQICGQLEIYAPTRRLQIDHDKALGFWAVRGLLCMTCNCGLGRDLLAGPEVDAYLANPWYRGLPFADQIKPETLGDEIPVDLDVAADLLGQLARHAADARRRQVRGWRDIRQDLIDLVRAANRAGMRQVDIVKATGTLTRDQVYAAVKERRMQPDITGRSDR